jgi:hypothetical protein
VEKWPAHYAPDSSGHALDFKPSFVPDSSTVFVPSMAIWDTA